MAAPMPALRPSVGFCLQTQSTGSPPGRWFVNVTKHKLCEMPVAYSGQKVGKDWILANGIGNMQVPFDMGSFRKVKGERGEGAKHTTWAIDVVFCPLIVQLFMDDDFCNSIESYRPFVINLILKRIEESINVKLSQPNIKLVKAFRYKDGEEGDNTMPREFSELPDEKDCFDEEVKKSEPPKPAEPEEPLIEDITPGQKKKPAIKKGFLNGGKGKSLYGDEGSKEGVLPENAGDPLGYLPKKLRQTCKIVDCAGPEYQAQQKAAESSKQERDEVSEFNRNMLKDLDKWAKAAEPDKWEADAPDGADEPARKYDNDYSRFKDIEEEEEKPEPETRDYYFDHNGVPRKFEQPAATKSTSSSTGTKEAAVKKGFLENAKKELYPEGSSQGKTGKGATGMPHVSDEALMREMENMSPEDLKMMGDLQSMLKEAQAQGGPTAPPKTAVAPKQSVSKSPDFTLSEMPDGLQLVIQVPELESMKGVDLDVTERKASVAFPGTAGLKPLQVELPSAVVPTGVKAKFSKKTHQITISLPAASAAQGGA
mmetsp:Transcript_42368/g.76037  ORF Transcript_42368/g.76037 Transcript_42368/m.76037 type:complete len:539 (+) Transcript_42368:54-1670(+)